MPVPRICCLPVSGVLLFLIISFCLPAPAAGQTLGVGSASGVAGSSVDLTIGFTAGADVAAMDFEVRFPASLSYVAATAGTATLAADKILFAEISEGGAKIVIYGLNQKVIRSGPIAVLRLNIAPGTPLGTLAVTLADIIAAAPNASSVAVSASGGGVLVTAQADTTPPVISGIRIFDLAGSGARITWTTNEESDSQIEYGVTSSYGSQTVKDAGLGTHHSQELSGLLPDTLYHYRILSRDIAGNLVVSQDRVFTTADGSAFAPQTSLFYPRPMAAGSNQAQLGVDELLGLAFVNLDSGTATIRITALDNSGNVITGPNIKNPTTMILEPGNQVAILDNQLFGDGFSGQASPGWIKLESNVGRIAGFFLMFDSRLSVLDGAVATSAPLTSFLLPEIEASGYTKIHLINPAPAGAGVIIELVDAGGHVVGRQSPAIPPHGTLFQQLYSDLFADSSPDSGNYLRITTASGILGFEMLGKTTQYVEGLNGQNAVQGATTLYCPQYVIGGPWRSSLSVINLDSTPGQVRLHWVDDHGVEIATRILDIAANGKIHIDDPAFFVNVQGTDVLEGYVEIAGLNGLHLSGSVIFGDREQASFASALPLVSTLESTLIFSHIASDVTYFTGLAVLNPGALATNVTVELYDEDGTLQGLSMVPLSANERVSRLLPELFPSMTGQNWTSGYFRVTADRGVAAFALFGTHNLSALSAIPPQVVRAP